MPDDRHRCSNLLVPGLVGGLVGAALTEASRSQRDALLRREMEKIADLEHKRLAEEKKRHQLAQAEVQNNEADRAHHRAVLWLSHCNNEERLDYLVVQNRETLSRQLAGRLTAETLLRPPATERLAARTDTRARLSQCRQEHHAWQQESAMLQRERWTFGGVFLVGLFSVGAIMVPLLYAFDSRVIPYGGFCGLVLALLSPVIARLQPPPDRSRSGGNSAIPTRTFAQHQTRHALVGILRAEAIARLERQLVVQGEELHRLFAANEPTWLATAERHVWAIRPLIEAAQRDYPPRVRCDLGALSDAVILARLRDTLPPAFATQLEYLLHN